MCLIPQRKIIVNSNNKKHRFIDFTVLKIPQIQIANELYTRTTKDYLQCGEVLSDESCATE
jgi:hypothetical protein